ncbi:MAG TPA: hypothetical protein VGM92_05100 [Candidatus Kapabacteria bacterium]|jgi:hypothetical protein
MANFRPIKNSNARTTPRNPEPPPVQQRDWNLIFQNPSLWSGLAAVAISIYGIIRAIDLRWICDDAFITMRYVRNFVDGNGLVYNIGERMEGYTHFLWLLLLAASKGLGFDPVDASMWLGIACFAGILILLLLMSHREQKKNPISIWLPVATTLFALNYDAQVWATGGLETALFALLIVLAFFIFFYTKLPPASRFLWTGFTLALLALTRPDGVLFTLVFAVSLLIKQWSPQSSTANRTSGWKSLGMLLLPSIVIGIPYLVWKYFYYGNLLPLPYYAKSGGGSFFEQGFFYIWLYFRVYFLSAIALIAGMVLLIQLRKVNAKTDGAEMDAENNDEVTSEFDPGLPWITMLAAIATYLVLFVARVGGDFMFARFIIPVVPLVYFVIEQALLRMPAKVPYLKEGIAVVLLLGVLGEKELRQGVLFHPNKGKWETGNWQLPNGGSTRGIADERWTYYFDRFFHVHDQYTPAMEVYTEAGKYLEPFFEDMHWTVAVGGGENMRAYYANFSNCINEFGLTDSTIAHSNIMIHGRIGHEKVATENYLEQRHADFELGDVVANLPEPLPEETIAFEIPTLGFWQLARVVTYDKIKMEELNRRFEKEGNKSMLPLYEEIIPYYVVNVMPKRSLRQVEYEFAEFRHLYFNRYPDTSLMYPIERRIRQLQTGAH